MILLNSLFCNTQCTLNSNHLLNIVMALDLLQYWREEVLHLQSARYYSSLYCMELGAHIFSLCLYRVAIQVEEIYSESASRLQLSTGEEIKNETFPSSSIVFTEIKVCYNRSTWSCWYTPGYNIDSVKLIINCTHRLWGIIFNRMGFSIYPVPTKVCFGQHTTLWDIN
jgi:hypothetical protein